ncbi:30S ribosomal protein S9 [Candidatus Dojkabacteria bacterium]|nr:30S ribosomal protein S9 [Candidatus Dojkabacteria bacterium]
MSDRYKFATGRRKTSVATIRLYEGVEKSTINGKPVEKVCQTDNDLKNLMVPLQLTDGMTTFYFTAMVKGGGVTGQIEAIRHALSRALVSFNEEFKPIIKKAGLLTRDPRMVERKKPGKVKARKSPQFSKR